MSGRPDEPGAVSPVRSGSGEAPADGSRNVTGPKSQAFSAARRAKRWWFERPWWVRYAAYVLVPVSGFYVVEDLRGWWAWERHLEDGHVEGSGLPAPGCLPPAEGETLFADTLFVQRFGWGTGGGGFLEDPGSFEPDQLVVIDGSGATSADTLNVLLCFPDLFRRGATSPEMAVEHAREELAKRETLMAIFAEAAEASPGTMRSQPVRDGKDLSATLSLDVGSIREFVKAFELHAHVCLLRGDSEPALDDVETILRFARNLAHRGTLIDATFASAMVVSARTIVWHGLDTRAWDEEQLDRLAGELAGTEPARWTQWALWAERERFLPLMRELEKGPVQRYHENEEWGYFTFPAPPVFAAELAGLSKVTSGVVFAAIPNGWARRASLHYCLEIDYSLSACLEDRPEERRRLSDRYSRRQRHRGLPDWLITDSFAMGISSYAEGAWRFETFVRQMRCAVSLERTFLATGSYPLPGHEEGVEIPVDPYSGKPFVIRFESDGRPLLYSFGPNETDEGGVAGATFDSGDLIWRYRVSK